jgi:hypothetical protein
MPSPNLILDHTFQTGVAFLSSDGTVVDNGDGTFRIDFTGQSSVVNLTLSRPIDPTHRHQVRFAATGDPRGLHPIVMQGAFNELVFGGSLFAAGSYDHVLSAFNPPAGVLQLRNNAMVLPFSINGEGLEVIDLDADS